MTNFDPVSSSRKIALDPETMPRVVAEACEWLEIRPEDRDALQRAATRMAGSEPWLALLRAEIPRLLDDRMNFAPRGEMLPGAEGDPQRDLFYAVALLLALEHPRRMHRALGVSEAVSRRTLQDLRRWLDDFREKHGRPGFDNPEWISKAWRGKIYALGRLQFEPCRFASVAGLYDVAGGTPSPLVLANDGIAVGADDRPLPETAPAGDVAWKTRCSVEDGRVHGHAITPDGRVRRRPETWRLGPRGVLLAAGHRVLSVHIPAGAPLRPEACADAYRQALEFFERPGLRWEWRALVCHSWLMDPRLADVLDGRSHIVRFQRDYHPAPSPDGKHDQIWERVFGARPDSLHDAPRDTSLRRAVLDFALAGGEWRLFTGVFLRDEVAARIGEAPP